MKRTVVNLTLLGVALLIFSGCVPRYESLKPDQKRDIYERVTIEAKAHRARGELLEEMGYLHRALDEYEQANFYGATQPVPADRLDPLRARIEKETPKHYKRAQKALQSGKSTEALEQLNQVMRLNPHYKQAATQRAELLKLPEHSQQMQAHEHQLQTLLAEPNPDQEAIDRNIDALLRWQHDHPLAFKQRLEHFESARQAEQQGLELLNLGRTALRENRLEAAEKHFKAARSIDITRQEAVKGLVALQNRKDAIYYLNLAKREQRKGNLNEAQAFIDKGLRADRGYAPIGTFQRELAREQMGAQAGRKLAQAKEHLKNRRYLLALQEVEGVLEHDPGHKEALALQAEIEATISEDAPRLLSEAESLFDRNRYDESARLFESVLQVDPDNNVSKTYLERIQSRRETLEMLNR
jgi:tetratricopeptide (TPR) repeat protein